MIDSDFAFDADALRQKYREERDKRLRTDANAQYADLNSTFSSYAEDPYVAPGFHRTPCLEQVDTLVIGGGFGGLMVGARLREAGVQDIRMVEKGGDFGGTWSWNRYPGAACDVESYVYLPLLEELGTMPSREYARGPEILEHCRNIACKYDLYRDVLFQISATRRMISSWSSPSTRSYRTLRIGRWIRPCRRDRAGSGGGTCAHAGGRHCATADQGVLAPATRPRRLR